jgi:hypothetical protein
MIMTYNRMLPNKVDLVLNREISLLVLLKNKIAQPDLFGVHTEKGFEMLSRDKCSPSGVPLINSKS